MKDLEAVWSGFQARDERIWDALWARTSIGRVAVAVLPDDERLAKARTRCRKLNLADPEDRPAGWTEDWREALRDQIASVAAHMELPGDYFPALNVPRFVHGQSQGLCDVFGARLEPHPREKDLLHVHPLPAEPGWVDDLVVWPLTQSVYWGAVSWIRYARSATHGRFAFRNPVMTGPLDTVNYLLGTTALMEWMYHEPAALHRLLKTVTQVLIDLLRAVRDAAGGNLAGDEFSCLRGGPCLCSECRSLISRQHFETFEAPCLRRIGQAVGTYGIHACGSWERTVPASIDDPNLRAMHGQVRENDLNALCDLSAGRMTFSIGPSENLDAHYTWSDRRDFYDHVLTTVPPGQPTEIRVREADVAGLNASCRNRPGWKVLDRI